MEVLNPLDKAGEKSPDKPGVNLYDKVVEVNPPDNKDFIKETN